MILLEIPDAPPSENLVLRMSWQRRYALSKKWRKYIWAARCQVIRGRPTPIAKAKVTIERSSPKLLDKDNLYGSVKIVVDALRCNELIVDDNPECLDLEVTQRMGPAKHTDPDRRREPVYTRISFMYIRTFWGGYLLGGKPITP